MASASSQCPVARSVARIGDAWSLLILRDCFYGLRRFDELQASLGIATNMLARRLRALVADGLLARERYSAHPPRYEYVLTAAGRDVHPVLLALLAWGNRHFAPEGASIELVEARTGRVVRPQLVDRETGARIAGPDYALAPGPAANADMRARLEARGTAPFVRSRSRSRPAPRAG